jgi:UDP-3-O-[3-hydroxymyristoyl] glucosamine N-acyltransferase
MPPLRSLTGQELADLCKGRLHSPKLTSNLMIRNVSTLVDAGEDAVSWICGNRHASALAVTKAAIIVGSEKLLDGHPCGLVVTDPELAIAEVLDYFLIPADAPAPGIHPTAVVHPTVKLETNVAVGAQAVLLAGVHIGANSVIHEGVSLGRDVRVGRDTVIYDRVVVYDRCELGDRVIIHSGAVIGADGFGYIFRNGQHRKTAHIGTVIIDDDVEIGANSCVDRAKIGATRIGRGTKIDNLVQVAHNVQLGPLCLLAGQTGISGSVRVGAGVAMGGQTGITDGLSIGDRAQIAATSNVFSDVEAGAVVFGSPAQNKTTAMRDQARVRRLGALFEKVAELSRRVAELEAAANHPNDR